MAKIAYAWVVDWNLFPDKLGPDDEPNLAIDLYFSSREKFIELLGWGAGESEKEAERLVPINVGDNFDKWDFIPDTY